MARNRVQLRRFVRFQLEQMSERNEQHQFEQMTLELARLRVCSNVLPATGPVQAGGDQGLDFETYKTYLSGTPIANSTFIGRAGSDTIAFCCTLQRKDVSGKVKSDLKKILGAPAKPDRVDYFAATDVTVAARHKLQKLCQESYGVPLDIFDGQAISDMLSDPDTFWIAEEFLSVPAEMFPPVELDSEYAELRDRWLESGTEVRSYADFLDVKRGLRRATSSAEAKLDLSKWIQRMRGVAADGETPFRRKAMYEIIVAQLKGRRNLDPEIDTISDYFTTFPQQPGTDELEDAAVLASYCYSAIRLGHFHASVAQGERWLDQVKAALHAALKQHLGDAAKFTIFVSRASLEFQSFIATGDERFVDVGLQSWRRALEVAEGSPLCDAERLADLLDIAIPVLGENPDFRALLVRVDRLVEERGGKAAAADRCRARSIAYAEAGNLVAAVEQLQQTKLGWFAAETMDGSILAMLLLSQWYGKLHLAQAARFYAAAAFFVASKSDNESLLRYVPRAMFEIARTFFLSGEFLTYLAALRSALGLHAQLESDAGDTEKHPDFSQSLAQSAVVLSVLEKCAPDLLNRAEDEIKDWPVHPDYLQMITELRDNPAWSKASCEELESRLSQQLGQRIDADIGNEVRIRWKALGVDWTIKASSRDRVQAESLAAILQIVQVDFAEIDILIVPSNVDIEFESASVKKIAAEQIADNEKLRWHFVIPNEWAVRSDENEFEMTFSSVVTVLLQATALHPDKFFAMAEERFEKGLVSKAFWVRPTGELLAKARSEAELSFDPSTIKRRRTFSPDPLEHEELAWPTSVAASYSRRKAEEYLANRYRTMMPFARQVIPKLLAEPRWRERFRQLHDDGLLDWQIMLLLFNISIRQLTERRIGPTMGENIEAAKKISLEVVQYLSEGGDPKFDASAVTDEDITDHLKTVVMANAKTWNLAFHRQTPDFEATKKLLDVRFGQASDDIGHEDVFRWSEMDLA